MREGTPASPAHKGSAYLQLTLAMATVGSIVPASRVIAGALPPALAGAVRLLVAAAILVPWAALRERASLREPRDLHDKLLLAAQAAAGTVGFTVLLVLGTARTTAAAASVVAGTLPAVAALLSVLLFRERPGALRWLAVALAVAGLLVVQAPGGGAGGAERLSGNLLVLGAVACESLFILLQKRLHRPLPALSQSAVMTVLGLCFLAVPAALALHGLDAGRVPGRAWAAVVYYGLVPTVLGFVLWYRGAARVSGAEAGVLTAVMPLSGAALSALVLGEHLGASHLLALCLVVAAVATAALAPAGGRASERSLPARNAAGASGETRFDGPPGRR